MAMRMTLRRVPGAAARPAARIARRNMCARADGFTEALPKRDVVAPILCAGMYGFSWWMADEGRVQALAEQVEVNTDPSQNPTPTQVFHHIWPFVAGTLAMLFDSVACKFSQTKDMAWLCTAALNDDTNAAVALSLLVPPAEHSPAFVRAVCAQPGALRRVNDIVQIYKTLPREQHDDVVVNACILAAKVAALPELREQGLPMADFVWMMPEDKAHMYTQYGVEGLARLWQTDMHEFLVQGGVVRLAELVEGGALFPKKAESSPVNQLLAHRVINGFAANTELMAAAVAAEDSLAAEVSATRTIKKRTLWQRAGVHRGETEHERGARMRAEQLQNVRGAIAALRAHAPRDALTAVESYASYVNVACAGLLGVVYGAIRGYGRAWWQEVTPSVCRELSAHAAKRTCVGAMLLVAVFESGPFLKRELLGALGQPEATDYGSAEALRQLVGVDAAYIGAIALANFFFPFVLVPVVLNPAQLLVLPSDKEPPAAPAAAAKGK